MQVSKSFRFLNFWTKHEDFQKIVQDSWKENITGSPFQIVHKKLKKVKSVLASWSRATFREFFQNVATLVDIIKVKKSQLEIQPTPENRE